MLFNWMSSTTAALAQRKCSLGDQPTVPAVPMLEAPATFAQTLLQFCTNLMVAGVLEQIADVHAPVQATFRVGLDALDFDGPTQPNYEPALHYSPVSCTAGRTASRRR